MHLFWNRSTRIDELLKVMVFILARSLLKIAAGMDCKMSILLVIRNFQSFE